MPTDMGIRIRHHFAKGFRASLQGGESLPPLVRRGASGNRYAEREDVSHWRSRKPWPSVPSAPYGILCGEAAMSRDSSSE
jgi:hypothetical protein